MRLFTIIFLPIFVSFILCRCEFPIHIIKEGEFDPRLDVIASNLSIACRIILTRVNARTIHVLSSSSVENEHPNDFTIFKQLRNISAYVVRTFSHLEIHEEQDAQTTCENEVHHTPRALVIAVRPNKDDLVNVLYDRVWSPETVFVVVVENSTQALRQVVQTAWKRKNVFRVALISTREPSTVVRLFEPWIRCSKVRFRKVTYLKPDEMGTFLTRPVKTMRGCELRVAMYERPQTAVILTNGTFTGQDGKLIELLSSKMNFTPRIALIKGRMMYGEQIENGTRIGMYFFCIKISNPAIFNECSLLNQDFLFTLVVTLFTYYRYFRQAD